MTKYPANPITLNPEIQAEKITEQKSGKKTPLFFSPGSLADVEQERGCESSGILSDTNSLSLCASHVDKLT